MKDALLIVDVQNDFCPGGALAVPQGDAVVPFINRISGDFELLVATKDWHPQNHGSFASNHPGKKAGQRIELNGLEQILWPDHCVQHTPGSDFHPGLDVQRIGHTFYKGEDPQVDSYSAFFDNAKRHDTGLWEFLNSAGVTDVWICGLALDYCVAYSALDAVQTGFKTHVLLEGTRGIDLSRGDIEKALERMSQAGIDIVSRYASKVR
jgi:nicotinamidase/pyrazinamidase